MAITAQNKGVLFLGYRTQNWGLRSTYIRQASFRPNGTFDASRMFLLGSNDTKIKVWDGTAWVFVSVSSAALTSGYIPVATTNGKLTDSGFTTTNLSSGTYTPTLTNVANLDGSTAFECQYMRVGNTVSVSGKVSIDPTLTATSTQLGISLPITSNLANAEDCSGVAFASGIVSQGAAILADTTNDRAQLQYISGDVTDQPMYFTFIYQVI